MKKASVIDRATGYLAEHASRASAMAPSLGRFVVGNDPRFSLEPWRVTPLVEEPLSSDRTYGGELVWAHHRGDPKGTRLPWPAQYQMVVKTLAHRGKLELLSGEFGDNRLAVCWPIDKLGAVVMARVLSDEDRRDVIEHGAYYMRVGGNDLDTAIGAVDTNGIVHIRAGIVSLPQDPDGTIAGRSALTDFDLQVPIQ